MGKVFCFTDIHGHYLLYDAIINWCLEDNDDVQVVFCGDACDRGFDGYKIICELINNPQVIYLKGNHEDMFTQAARSIIGYYAQNDAMYAQLHSCTTREGARDLIYDVVSETSYKIRLYLGNEGESTLIDWILDGANEEIIDKIERLPLAFSYKNIDFCHSGSDYDYFKEAQETGHNICFAKNRLLWDRDRLPFGWETGRVCVFGHTPTVSLPHGIYGRDHSLKHAKPCAWQDKMGAKHKRGGWKIDMDTGTTWSNRAYLLDCDTMELILFELCDDALIKISRQDKIIEEI